MLGVFPDSTPDIVDKNLGFAQALAKEGLESFAADKDVSLVLYLMLGLAASGTGRYFSRR